METQHYTPDDFLAGDEPLKTGRGYIKAGQIFPRLTPLMRDGNTLVAWDGTPGAAVVMSARPAEAPASNQLSAIYKGGCFRINHVNWPDSVTTDEQKRSAFLGGAVSVDDH